MDGARHADDPDGVDYDGLGRLVESQIEGGVRGLVAVGTTGESPTLDAAEHIDVIKFVIKTAGGACPCSPGRVPTARARP